MYKKLLVLGLIISAYSYGEKVGGNFETRLDESVITSERYEATPIIESDKNITVITGEDIEKRGYKTIEEALKTVPSLFEADGEFSLRGQVPKMGNKTLVILVDGVPQNGMDNRAYDLDFIPLDQIEQIEVVPSGGTIMYGGNATAGVINIVTKANPNKKYWGKVSGQLGSFNKRELNVNTGMKVTDKLDASVSYSVDDKKGYREHEKKDLDFIEFKSDYKLEDGKITFKYNHNKRDGNGKSALSKEDYEENRRANKRANTTDIQDKYIVTFNKKITSNLDASGVVEYRDRSYRYKKEKSKTNTDFFTSRKKHTKSLYTNAQLKYTYANSSNIIFGGDYSRAKVKEDTFKFKGNNILKSGYNKTKYEAIGGYVKNKIAYGNFLFTQGVRVEKNKFDENKIIDKEHQNYKPTNTNFELGASYLIDKDKSVYLSFNQIKRSPNLTEYTSWDSKLFPNKKSQKMNNVELGTKLLIENVYLSAATYYSRTANEIMYDPGRDDTNGSFYNLHGKTERMGFELASEQYFDKLTLRQNFSYIHSKITSGKYDGKEIPGVPKLMAGIGATYEIIDNLLFNLETYYRGKKYFANDFKNEKGKNGGYTVTNISLRYDFTNGVSLYGGIDKLFDKKYCSYTYIYNGVEKYQPNAERTYYVGFDYKF